MIEPDYDNLNIVRMAIVERDDRLVVLMPVDTPQDYVDNFMSSYANYGWPTERIMVMVGPEAFAVLKPSKDEGQGGEEQSKSDEVDSVPGETESSNAKADGGQNPEQKIDSESHSSRITPTGQCSHGVDWKNMPHSHWAMKHKTDHS